MSNRIVRCISFVKRKECKLQLKDYDYVELIETTGNLIKDIENLYCRNGKAEIWKHVCKVATTSEEVARAFSLDSSICKTAAYLHDISAIIRPADMLRHIKNKGENIDFAEEKHPFLLHQRISKDIAKNYFKISEENVLSAICCHTTLRSNPSPYDMVVFIADKLSWDQSGEPPYYDIVKSELSSSLESACLTYIDYVLSNGMVLCPHSWLLDGQRYLSHKSKSRKQ